MSEFELRSYRPGDEAHIVKMFERTFGAPYGEALWRWKYADSPYARPELSVVATGPGGELVGHGAVFCQPLNLIGRRRDCGQVADLMIDPAMQRTGMGTAIYEGCARSMAGAGFPVCLAFPNERSAVALHWLAAHVAIMEKYALPIDGPAHDALRAQVEAEPEDARLDLTWAPDFSLDPRADDLFASIARLESLSICKDAEYLTWRYEAQPERDYRISALLYGDLLMGLAVTVREGRALRVLELLVRDKQLTIARRLLLRLAEDAGEGVRELRFIGRDPWFLEGALAAFERRPAFSHHLFARALDRDMAHLYENPLNWTCTLGDCDSV